MARIQSPNDLFLSGNLIQSILSAWRRLNATNRIRTSASSNRAIHSPRPLGPFARLTCRPKSFWLDRRTHRHRNLQVIARATRRDEVGGEPSGLVQNIAPISSMAADTGTVTMAFGVLGPVAGQPRAQSAAPMNAPAAAPAIPKEAEPYIKYVPQWLLDKLPR